MDEIEENIKGSNDYETLMNNIIKDKGGSRDQYESLLLQFGHVESKNNPTIHQIGGGPGRGKYQFEGKGGSNRILTSAVRTKNYFKQIGSKVPDYINNIISNGTGDASKLTEEQQDILVLGDLRMKKGLNLADYANGNLKSRDIWVKHWWAGSDKLKDQKLSYFDKSVKNLFNNKKENYNNNSDLKQPQYFDKKNAYKTQVQDPRVDTKIDNTSIQAPQINKIQYNQNKQQPVANQPLPNNPIAEFKSKNLNGDLSGYLNQYLSSMPAKKKELNEFNNGGTHEENPYGGIPLGTDSQGTQNTVEQKETSYEFEEGKYIFSNRIKLDGSGMQPNASGFANGGNLDTNCGGKGQPPCSKIKNDNTPEIKSKYNWDKVREENGGISPFLENFSEDNKKLEQKRKIYQAKEQMKNNGITDDLKKSYVKGKSEKAFNNITPQGYGDLSLNLDRANRYKNNKGRNKEELLWFDKKDSPTGKKIYGQIPKRDDAFSMYLGLSQKNNSFGVSDYKPSTSKDENKLYYKPNYLNDHMKQRMVDDFIEKTANSVNIRRGVRSDGSLITNERNSAFTHKLDSLKKAGVDWSDPKTSEWFMDNPMGDFKMSKGEDENGEYISIYDKWDLNPFSKKEGSSSNKNNSNVLLNYLKMMGKNISEDTEISEIFKAGKPFEIYDRIYIEKDKNGAYKIKK